MVMSAPTRGSPPDINHYLCFYNLLCICALWLVHSRSNAPNVSFIIFLSVPLMAAAIDFDVCSLVSKC